MAVIDSESVLNDLRRLPLLNPEQKARVVAAATRSNPGPEKIVYRLVHRGWLTNFQAEALLTAKGKGLVFGDYVLLSKLGEGGMGVVFKARHLRLDRIDALKVIRTDRVGSSVVARRFQREIQLTADLNHPHIVKALDAGQVGKQFYLATEYVPGEDLTATVRREGVFLPADACLVIYQTALALQHIHERGLIHRDLKPSNIMREDRTRAVKVLDLGLCHSLNELSGSNAGTLTRDGVMLGTPDFMPPEQARNPHGVDIRADLYALGCTFFYLLTGRTPYEGSPMEKLLQHASAPVPPLVLPRCPTPPALAEIVSCMMAKRPEDRFQTPQHLIGALLALRPGQPAPSGPGLPFPQSDGVVAIDEWQSEFDLLISQDPSASGASPIPREPKPVRRRSRAGWWAAAAVALAAVSVSGFLLARGKPTPEKAEADPAPVEEEASAADELKALKKSLQSPGENREQLRNRVLTFRARNAGKPPAVGAAALLRKLPSPLDRLAPGPVEAVQVPAIRLGEPGHSVVAFNFSANDESLLVHRVGKPPEEWALPGLTATGRFVGLAVHDECSATVSADCRATLAIDPDGELSIRAEGRTRKVKPADGSAARAAILPDGKSAVVALDDSTERLVRVSLETGKIVSRLDHPSEGVQSLTVSPDGASCLVFGPENMIRVLSLSTGKLLHAFDPPPNVEASSPAGAFGPDGQYVYLIGAASTAGRFSPGTATALATYEVAPEKPNPFLPRTGTSGRPTCIAVSSDESAVAVGTRSALHLYSAATGKMTQEIHFNSPVRAVAFSTHGRVLAVAIDDGSVLLIPIKS